MLLFHEVCHSSKIYLLIEGLKFENDFSNFKLDARDDKKMKREKIALL